MRPRGTGAATRQFSRRGAISKSGGRAIPYGSNSRPSLRAAGDRDDFDVLHAAGIIAILAGLALLVWKLSHLLLLVFAAALFATALRSVGEAISRWTGLPHAWSPTIAVFALVAAVVGIALAFGSQLEVQLSHLIGQLPLAATAAFERIRTNPLAQTLPWNDISKAVAGTLPAVGTLAVNVVADIVLVVAGGLFIAADPRLYRRGMVMLLPHRWRPRARAALETSGLALRQWLCAQLIMMLFIGVTVGVGLWLIGVPSFLGLGLIAGLSEFIPFLGPILGALPAILIAFGIDWQTAAWTAGLFLVVQQVENNLLQPLVASRMVSVPPALGMFAVIGFGTLFGVPGLLLAMPLTVVTMVMVTKLYLQPELGEDVAAPGESDDDQQMADAAGPEAPTHLT